MNILFYFDHQINPLKGGTERVSDLLAHYLKERGMGVYYCARYNEQLLSEIETLFLPDQEDLLSDQNVYFLETEIQARNIDYIINQASNGDDIYLFNHQKLRISARIISVFHFSIYEGLNYFKELQLLEFQLLKPMKWLPNLIRLLKRPYNQKKALAGKCRRLSFIYDASDAVVVLSGAYANDYKQVAHLKETHKLHIIPNPLTYVETKHHPKENILLFVGRLSFPEKRLDRLLYVWKQLYRKYPDWEMYIVGDGSDRERLENISRKLKLERVLFAGMRNPQPYYEKAKIVCMTSTHEGLPMVLLEAMQNRVVPMTFDSFGAASDLIADGLNGYLIPPFDINAYAARLETLMQDDNVWKAMSDQTTTNLEQYTIDNVCSRWLHLFEHLQ